MDTAPAVASLEVTAGALLFIPLGGFQLHRGMLTFRSRLAKRNTSKCRYLSMLESGR